MNIFLSFDFDYIEDYNHVPRILQTIGNTPVTFFLVGSRHPSEAQNYPQNVQIGNHSFTHEEWYETPLEERIIDLEKNHKFLKDMYGVDCKVYRSPHLRNFPDTAKEMVKRGYKPEMGCAECPHCRPISENLRVYFSSHHHFGPNPCGRDFLEMFQTLCEKGEDFTFFLDPHDFNTDERLEKLKHLIKIGNDFGKWKLL